MSNSDNGGKMLCQLLRRWHNIVPLLAELLVFADVVGPVKGLCQVEKYEKNSDWPDPIHQPVYPLFLFFWKQENSTKNTKKTENFKKN